MEIPWQDRAKFQEVLGSLARMGAQRGHELHPVRDLARKIQACFGQVSDELDMACSLTCPACQDNCCERATIWYDFRDLVYLYFGPGRMPQGQIVKGPGGEGCPNLTSSGCILPRAERPFVCTWYLCPDQKAMSRCSHLNEKILKIKEMRIQMENEFCRITASQPAMMPSGQL